MDPTTARIGPEGFEFLRALAADNSRAWFEPRAGEFRRVLIEPFGAALVTASTRLARGPWPLSGGPATVFRQLRDQRYAKAVPYATSVRGLLTSTGTKPAREGCVHVEVAPDGGFVGVGFHRPPAAMLAPIRQRMLDEPRAWRSIVDELAAAGHELTDDRLTRMPRGFESHADHSMAVDVRLRSLEFAVPLSPDDWESGRAIDLIVDVASAGMPLLRFGNDAAGFAPAPHADSTTT